MSRLRLVYDQDAWCIHSRAMAIKQYAPPNWEASAQLWTAEKNPAAEGRTSGHYGLQGVCSDCYPTDVVVVFSPGQVHKTAETLRKISPKTLLVSSWNTHPGRWPELFDRVCKLSDAVFVNCDEALHCLPVETRKNYRIFSTPNGVDTGIFNNRTKSADRQNLVIWSGGIMGSNYGRDDVKGYSQFLVPLMNRLHRDGIMASFVPVDPHREFIRMPREMSDWMNTAKVAVCASEFEGAANFVVESAACGCAIVSTPVGIVPTIPNAKLVARDVGRLYEATVEALEKYPASAAGDLSGWSWSVRAKRYFDLFDELLAMKLR